MKALFHLAADLQYLFMKNHWKFCFIGAIALQRWGEPRVTTDIDVTLLTGFGAEQPYVDELLKHYEGRISDAKGFALTKRVLLLRSSGGIAIDIALAALPFEEEAVKRSTCFEFLPGVKLLTCSAEDLIVMKAFAERDRDWLDIRGIIIRQGTKLDWRYIKDQLTPLCELKESPNILPRLDDLKLHE